MRFICRKFWQYLIKYKILPPFDQESLLEIYAINRLFPMVKGVYTRVFTSASFDKKEEREGRTKEEKNPNIHQYCVGSPQCNPMWLVHKNEYYVVIKNDLDLWGLIGKGHKIY